MPIIYTVVLFSVEWISVYFLALAQIWLVKSIFPDIAKYFFFPLVPTGSAPQHVRVSRTSHGRRSSKHFWSAGNQQNCFKYHKFLSESDYSGGGKLETMTHVYSFTLIITHSVYFFSMIFSLLLVEGISNLVPEKLSLVYF